MSRAGLQRDRGLDALRALAMLYIVGYWHLFEYATALEPPGGPVTYRLALVFLGVFVLVSGVLAGRGWSALVARVGAREAWAQFYKRRALRIVPLFVLAVLAFQATGLLDFVGVLKAVSLIAVFVKPAPPTLWFVCMLLVFYGVAPLLLAQQHSAWRLAAVAAALVATLAGYGVLTKALDIRVVMYLPAFALGVWLAVQRGLSRAWLPVAALLAGASVALSIGVALPGLAARLIDVPLICSAALLLFTLFDRMSAWLPRRGPLATLIGALAYAGFGLYLFHRPLMALILHVYFPAAAWGQGVYLVVVCLPLCVLAGWLVQRAYDALLAQIPVSERVSRGAAWQAPGP